MGEWASMRLYFGLILVKNIQDFWALFLATFSHIQDFGLFLGFSVYLFHYPRGYFTNQMNHALEGKIHGLWSVVEGIGASERSTRFKSGLAQGFSLRSSVRFYGTLDAPCIFSRPDFGTLDAPCMDISFCLQQNKSLNFFTFYYQSKNTEYS